ncbi:MAG: hypothetical protein AAGA76_02430, partial [Pseudomonadota bacterium]
DRRRQQPNKQGARNKNTGFKRKSSSHGKQDSSRPQKKQTKPKPLDPDSPFAALAALKNIMQSGND